MERSSSTISGIAPKVYRWNCTPDGWVKVDYKQALRLHNAGERVSPCPVKRAPRKMRQAHLAGAALYEENFKL